MSDQQDNGPNGSAPRIKWVTAATIVAFVVLSAVVLAAVLAITHSSTNSAQGANTATPQTGAIYTTTDSAGSGTGACLNGGVPDPVNCNIYPTKEDVFLNGGPTADRLPPGDYFFAVLDPGSQADPNDGAPGNLSSTHDAWTNRRFTVNANGTVSYSGTHLFNASNYKIQLAPYDDTTNAGGEYIAAVCAVPASPSTTNPPGAEPSLCKYDAYKDMPGGSTAPDPVGPTVIKDAAGAYTRTYRWGIDKSVDHNEIDTAATSGTFNYTVAVTHDAGTVSDVSVSGTLDVTNANVLPGSNPAQTLAVTLTSVTDQLSNGTTCVVDTSGGLVLSEYHTYFPYTCTLGALPTGVVNNTTTVTWADQTLSDGQFLAGGTHDFTVPNVPFFGTVADGTVTVSDPAGGGTLGTVSNADPSPTYFHYSHEVTGTPGTCVNFDNTASFVTNTSGTTGSSNQRVTLCEGVDLQAGVTASTHFTRTYHWDIHKAVDRTRVYTTGSTATFHYQTDVAQTGWTDAGWRVTGTITVTNPNDFESVTAYVSDAVSNGGTCTVPDGSGAVVAASSQVNLSYSCTYSSAPSPASGVDTATVLWDSGAAHTPNASAQATADFVFGDPTSRVNRTITPTDTFNGGAAVNLCDLTTIVTPCHLSAVDVTPLTAQYYLYARVIPVTLDVCVSYPNTVDDTVGQTSSVTVTVCGPVVGGHTIGFWQNNNGQAMITTGSSVGGVCASATWLRQFTMFQDLSATATCAQTAAYVYNLVRVATCAGSTCNSMLKAQSLATALGVYFSDPALGGNRTNSPLPLGAQRVDLTRICEGICGPGVPTASSAFGNAPSLTVLQMLQYASTRSNVGGTAWYAQVKSLQVLAKDAFDAVNNNQAFGV